MKRWQFDGNNETFWSTCCHLVVEYFHYNLEKVPYVISKVSDFCENQTVEPIFGPVGTWHPASLLISKFRAVLTLWNLITQTIFEGGLGDTEGPPTQLTALLVYRAMWGRVANQDPCRTLASGLCKHKENVGRDILEELVPSWSWSCGCTLMRGVNRACGSQHGIFLNRETSFDWPAVMFCRGMWSTHTLEEASMFSVWRAVWCHVWVWVQHSFLNVWGKSHLLLSWAT